MCLKLLNIIFGGPEIANLDVTAMFVFENPIVSDLWDAENGSMFRTTSAAASIGDFLITVQFLVRKKLCKSPSITSGDINKSNFAYHSIQVAVNIFISSGTTTTLNIAKIW